MIQFGSMWRSSPNWACIFSLFHTESSAKGALAKEEEHCTEENKCVDKGSGLLTMAFCFCTFFCMCRLVEDQS